MKLATISPYAITVNKYKKSNGQTSNFCKQTSTCLNSTKSKH